MRLRWHYEWIEIAWLKKAMMAQISKLAKLSTYSTRCRKIFWIGRYYKIVSFLEMTLLIFSLAHCSQCYRTKHMNFKQNHTWQVMFNQSDWGLSELISFTDSKSLTFALEKELSKTFLELAIMCKAIICCMSIAHSSIGVHCLTSLQVKYPHYKRCY